MKRYLNLTIISVLVLVALAGCNKTASVSETKESQVVEDETIFETEYVKEVKYPEDKIDIDLTTMSPTMVKSVVSSLNMSYEICRSGCKSKRRVLSLL